MVGHFFLDNFAVPFLQNVHEKTKLFVLLIELATVKLLKLETGVHFGLKQFLNVFLELVAVVEGDYVLQRCRHLSIRTI